MIEKEIYFRVVLLTQANLNRVRDFEKRMKIAHLPEPGQQIMVKMLVAERANVNGFSQAKSMHSHRGATGIKVFGISSQNLAILRLNEVAPKPGCMEVSRRESSLKREMVFFTRRELVELDDLHAKEVS